MYLINPIKTEPQSKIKIYDLIISMGEACSCTQCLRSFNLQEFSYPLDWLFGATFSDRIEIITSKFKNFINKEDLVFSHTDNLISTDAYRNTANNICFNHDFPKDIPLDISYDEVREKYDRRINRLLEKINNAQKVLFVYIEIPTTADSLKSNTTLISAQEKLAKAFPTTKCDILYLKNDINLPLNFLNYENVSERILKVSLFNKNLTPGLADYVINFANTTRILNKYILNKESINLDVLESLVSLAS